MSDISPKKSVQMDIWEEMTDKNEILRKIRTFNNFVIFSNFGMKIGEILVEKS